MEAETVYPHPTCQATGAVMCKVASTRVDAAGCSAQRRQMAQLRGRSAPKINCIRSRSPMGNRRVKVIACEGSVLTVIAVPITFQLFAYNFARSALVQSKECCGGNRR